MRLKIFGTIFFSVTFLLLLGDSFYYPASSLKYFLVDSRVLYSVFILSQILVCLLNRRFLPEKFVEINNRFIFPLTILIFLPAAIVNGAVSQYFIFNTFKMNLENFKYLFYLSGFVLMANIHASWLKTFPQKLLYFGGIIYIIIFSFYGSISSSGYDSIIKEDGVLENIQVIFYSIAAVFAFLSAYLFSVISKKVHAIFFLLLTIGLFFITGEELSWGQRLFHIHPPVEYVKINLQEEMTIHILPVFQSKIDYVYMMVGLWGAFSAILTKKLFTSFYKKYSAIFPMPILFFFFFAVTRFYFLNKFVVFNYQLFSFEKVGIGSRQEISETLLAFGFVCFSILTYKSLKK